MARMYESFRDLRDRLKSVSTDWKPRPTCKTLRLYRAIGWKRLKANEKANIASASMTNGGFAVNGRRAPPAPSMLKSSIIIKRFINGTKHDSPRRTSCRRIKRAWPICQCFSKQIGVPVNRVTAIINGQRGISAETALRLGHWFGTTPEFWLNLQNIYDLRLARAEVGERVERLPTLTDYAQIQ